MDKLSSTFSSMANTGAEIGLDEVFIIIFIALIFFAMIVGYLLGKKVSNDQKKAKKKEKKAAKAEKKAAKEQAKLDKELAKDQAKEEKQQAKEAKKEAKKDNKESKKEQEEPELKWVDTDEISELPSAMPLMSEDKSTSIFIPQRSEDSPVAAPVVTIFGKKKKPTNKADALKVEAQKEAEVRKAEERKKVAAKKEEERANALSERLNANIEEKQPAPVVPEEEPKKKRGLFAKKAKEEAPVEETKAEPVIPAPAPVETPVEEPTPVVEEKEPEEQKEKKLSRRELKKQKKADLKEAKEPAATVQVEADENAAPVTAEEMAQRLAALGISDEKPTVSIGAAPEETSDAEVGQVELSVQPGIAAEPVSEPEKELDLPTLPDAQAYDPLEETRRLNAVADKEEEERKAKQEAALPSFSFASSVESSADDVQLSSRQRKKLQQAQEDAEKEEDKKNKKSFSLFGKGKEEEVEEIVEDDFEGWQEEIPDSLAGFGFTAAPAMKEEDENK